MTEPLDIAIAALRRIAGARSESPDFSSETLFAEIGRDATNELARVVAVVPDPPVGPLRAAVNALRHIAGLALPAPYKPTDSPVYAVDDRELDAATLLTKAVAIASGTLSALRDAGAVP